ncbi:MAG TPA: serine/threonine-protein kinase [Kofleriaceae bacterium]|jgi:hypothetical protein|nr:serine/threonine-protein kinase [Kofleriaceae bacterium]
MPANQSPLLGRQLEAGAMVGEYQVTGVLEEGGMGTIYGAVQPVIGKRVAIKVLAAFLSQDETMTQRFIQEARAVNQIRHANIVDIFGFGRLPDGRLYCLMELLDGRSLKARREQEPPLSYEETLSILAQVCDALAAAHAEGIVHRDLKPDNIFLVEGTELRTVKLLDFGIAKLIKTGATDNKTEAGLLMGSPRYMSPEQCLSREVDGRADLYSLGVIMFELFTGRLPFSGITAVEMIEAHLHEPPPVPRDLAPTVPPELNDLIRHCLAKKAEERPASAAEVRECLVEMSISNALGVGAGLPSAIAQAAGTTPATVPGRRAEEASPAAGSPPPRRRVGPLAIAAAVVVVGFAAFGLYVAIDRLRGPGGGPAAAPAAGAETMVELQVISEPPGATVTFDGERQELLTPYVYRRHYRPEVRLRVELDGHRPQEQTVRLGAGEHQRALRVVLEPLAGAGADAGAGAAPGRGPDDHPRAGGPPVISDLHLRTTAVPLGSRTTVSADVQFSDPDGDVHAVVAEVGTGSRKGHAQRTRVNLRGVTSGTVSFTFVVKPAAAEPHTLEVHLVDDAEHSSNRLQAALEVNPPATPPPASEPDAGSPVVAPSHP